MPVPLRAMVSGEPGALLVIEILPPAAPVDVGEKVALKVELCPALRVVGTYNPMMLKPVPDATTCEIVTLAGAEFVNVIGTDPLPPTRMLPKLTFEGFAESAP